MGVIHPGNVVLHIHTTHQENERRFGKQSDGR